MKRPVKIVIAVIIVIGVSIGIYTASTKPLKVDTVMLETTNAKVYFSEQGEYVYTDSITLMPLVSGEVVEVKVKEGQSVKKGDIIAVISASDFEEQIKSLETTISAYQAQITNLDVQEKASKDSLKSTKAELQSQLAQVNYMMKEQGQNQKSLDKQLELQGYIVQNNLNIASVMRKEYTQAKEDHDSGLISDAELNAARANLANAQNAYDIAVQQEEQLKNGSVTGKESYEIQSKAINDQIAIIDARLASNSSYAMKQYYQAQITGAEQGIESFSEKVGDATILATGNGVITALPIADYNVVSPQNAVATISSNPSVEVYVPVREVDGVKVGDKVELTIDKQLGDAVLTGIVENIDQQAKIKTSALGIDERKVKILVSIDKADSQSINIGYSMDCKFTVFEQENTIIVPKTSVFEQDGKDSVWVITNGAAEAKNVTKGIETREGYSVSGLNAGEIVVKDANIEGLKAGKKVSPSEINN